MKTLAPCSGDLARRWFTCPHCGKNLVVYDGTSACYGVYIKCKGCGNEVEIKITK